MTTPRDKLRLVLLQVRNHQSSLMQERECFIERAGISAHQLRCINIVQEPQVRFSEIEDAHAVLIGGAGDYSVTETHPFTEPLSDLAHRLVDADRPLFAACWGHQFLAAHFGGEVVRDVDRAEIGTYDVSLTELGSTDPLLEPLPTAFPAQLGHQDRVERLGSDWDELAFSDLCANQMIRLRDKPVYGTQFHSEMDEARLRERIKVYLQNYMPDPDEYNAMCSRLRPSLDADQLINRFLELYT
ncbi:MAG: type 1 glutamine amidotransferase [bacterium]|nr:type 1 glutamine amidotransferase [bacterium]